MQNSLSALRLRRLYAGLKGVELAGQIGVKAQNLSSVELCRTMASRTMQDKLCNYYKCKREELFDSKGRAVQVKNHDYA